MGGQVNIAGDTHLFPDPVSAYFHTPHRDIQQRSDLFCRQIHFQECTKPQLGRCKVWIFCFHPLQEFLMYLIKGALKNLSLSVAVNLPVYL